MTMVTYGDCRSLLGWEMVGDTLSVLHVPSPKDNAVLQRSSKLRRQGAVISNWRVIDTSASLLGWTRHGWTYFLDGARFLKVLATLRVCHRLGAAVQIVVGKDTLQFFMISWNLCPHPLSPRSQSSNSRTTTSNHVDHVPLAPSLAPSLAPYLLLS